MQPIISLKNVSKVFTLRKKQPGILSSLKRLFRPQTEDFVAVDDISFEIQKGEVVGFIGPNGAGKSTTIKMLSGLLWPSKGEITVNDMSPQERREDLAYELGTVFGQRQQLWLHLPPIDTYNLFRHLYDIPKDEYEKRLEELTELFEIQELITTPVRKLSLGQRMRCELVAALLHNPPILFLDEPTIGIDLVTRKRIRAHIRHLNKQYETTIILTSHDLEDIEELCARVIIINHGKILYDGQTQKLKDKLPAKKVHVVFEQEQKSIVEVKGAQLESSDPLQAVYVVHKAKNLPGVLKEIMDAHPVADIRIEESQIEEIVEELFER